MNLFDTDQNGGHSCISATVDFSERFCLKILVKKIFFENKLESYGRLEVPKLSSWTQLKNLVKQQTKLMRIAWGVGIGSTLVVTAYTLQEMFNSLGPWIP